MPANVAHLVVDALKPAAVERIAAALGEPPAATRKALTTALPAALLGLQAKATTAKGADEIRDALHANRIDGAALDTLSSRPQLTAPAAGMLAGGQGAAERLMQAPTAQTAERLALYADVRRSSAQALLGLSVPLVLAGLVRAYPSPLDTASIQRALNEQAPFAHRAVPPGFGAVATAPKAAAEPEGGKDGWLSWLGALGVLALVVFGIGYWNASRGGGTAGPEAVESTANSPELYDAPSSNSQTAEVILPPAAAFAGELERYLASELPAPRNFRFEGLHFEKGSDELHGDSAETLDRVAAILRAYPNAQIEVEGHTDSRGGRRSNERLSEQRAAIVAEALIERGVDPSRVTSIGHGESRPVADNDTEAGRLENRRTELAITTKG